MKIFTSIALLIALATIHVKAITAHYSVAEKNKIDFFINSSLLKITRHLRASTELTVPKIAGHELHQVAVIEENKVDGKEAFEYVAVYKNLSGGNLKVVLYTAGNMEELVIDSVISVAFEEDSENSRILMERAGPDKQVITSALLVPGHIQVAHKG